MSLSEQSQRRRRKDDFYPLSQCALYKLRSKAKLCSILGVDLKRFKYLAGAPDNYRAFILSEKICEFTGKKTKQRFVQEPKKELRRIHDRLRHLLSKVIPPDYAHGAIAGRSYRTNADQHKSNPRVATFDIKDFYPSTREGAVYDFFHKVLCCSPDVSFLLTKVSCVGGKLPTGSPLSPVMSLYANIAMFEKLSVLARAHSLVFTCYIDDLTFSGKSLSVNLTRLVSTVVESYGHRLADRKTKIFGKRNAKHITGVVIKDGAIHVPHARFMKARAIQAAVKQSDGARKVALLRKQAGLLGEAAFLDQRFRGWAEKAQLELKSAISDQVV